MRHLLVAATAALASFVATGPTGFAQNPPRAVPKITAALDSDNKNTRFQAAAALGKYGTGAREAAPALKALVDREKEPQIALQAVQALTQIGAYAELRALMKHPGQHVRQQAVWGLGVIGPPAKKAVPELIRLLTSDQPLMPGLAAQTLSEIGVESEADTRTLIGLLADVEPEVRQYALVVVMNLGPSCVPALEKNLSDQQPIFVRTASLQALANQGSDAKSAVATLTKLLKDLDPDIRALSAAALASIGTGAKDALPDLLNSLLDKNVQVQMFAFQATIAVGQDDRRVLLDGLKNANAKGRWATPFALGTGLAGKAAVPGLLKDLESKDIGKRIGAALALGRIGVDAEPAIPALARMAKEENKQVRTAAQQALAMLDQKNREAYLQKIRTERANWVQDFKADLAKFAAVNARNVCDGKLDMLKAQAAIKNGLAPPKPVAHVFGLKDEVPLNVAVQNGPQQAYLRQMVEMHVVFSSSQDSPLEADWVRSQLSDTGTEAVPALTYGISLLFDYNPGFV